MLSAIAARKAAQAARQDSNVPTPEPSTPTLPPAEPKPIPKPTSKRKSSAQSANPPKRKKKEKRTPATASRYFDDADAFQDQDDVIIIDSDDEVLSEDPGTPDPTMSKRKWSPSIPMNDSSDEDEDIDVPFGVLPTISVSPRPKSDNSDVLSTFHPTLNQNMFLLDSAEVSALQLECDTERNATIVALRPEETLCLLGTYSVSVLQGSITLCGVTLSSSSQRHHVFAPRSSPLPVLEGADATGAIQRITYLPGAVQSLIASPVALVLLQELHTGVAGLGNVCRTFDGIFEPSRLQKPVAKTPFQLSGVHMILNQTKDTQAFDVPSSWKRALSSTSPDTSAAVHFVKGPKKSGKSTFARALVNSLLSRYQKVAYLECDLGQSEFTPGGMVALNVISSPLFGKFAVKLPMKPSLTTCKSLGPPFTHPTLPHCAHYIGAATPRSSPSHYLAAIQAILETYRLDIQTPAISWNTNDDDARISDFIPLVVNTMGWNKGLGADLTLKIQDMAQPTEVYEIEAPVDAAWPSPLPPPPPSQPNTHPSPSFSFSFSSSSHQPKQHLLQPIPPSALSTNYSAADHRSLAIISYFHALFPPSPPPQDELPQLTATAWRTSLPLCALPPYEVDITRTFDKVILTGAGTEDVVPSEIRRVLNGAVVALVACTPGTLDLDLDANLPAENARAAMATAVPYTQGSAPPSPLTSTCHGLALLRSVSPTSTSASAHVHVLTPLPHGLLMESRVLVKGELELPIWGMLDFRSEDGEDVAGVEKGKVPYLQWGKGEGRGAERRRVRRNLMRRGQM
ncbi:hypothetical protein D9615_009646 [Tricholomella constricta]|uniref:Polynucleotide 5'-hydroxyl-kinase GRC3 n=1 Tax=Tricholomella constricta TaxID=117010 RepID=A0A8H5GUX0_9AGAR|nr:hypothetical protein D9615_009646 [Tricholomella constricta]